MPFLKPGVKKFVLLDLLLTANDLIFDQVKFRRICNNEVIRA